MVRDHKPVAGSRGFWPRKRANRIYQSFKLSKYYLESMKNVVKETKPLMFAGYKAGMTYAIYKETDKKKPTFNQDVVLPVTIVETPPLTVFAISLYEYKNGSYRNIACMLADKLKKELKRKIKLPKEKYTKKFEGELNKTHEIRLVVHTNPIHSGIGKKKPEVFEIDVNAKTIKDKYDYAIKILGNDMDITSVFKLGEYVDVKSVTKGKGFQGVIKRFGVKERNRKHDKKMRHVGNIGVRNVARVLPGKIAMPGQLGFQTRTEYNKLIVKIGDKDLKISGGIPSYGEIVNKYILLHGSIPGPKKRLVIMRKAIRSATTIKPLTITHVSTSPQN